MSQISLTASMRSNLLSLQGTSQLMSQTQERLANGKKVNSAIDNASAYYTAQALSNRAGDLSSLLDEMGQAISTIKAANEGIESITAFVEQAKAVATSAFGDTDNDSRVSYAKQFNEILDQIDNLAKDSGYKGINLLKGDNLTVTFNESRDNTLTVAGVNADSETLGLSEQSWDISENTDVAAKLKLLNAAKKAYADIAAGSKVAYDEFETGGTVADGAITLPVDVPNGKNYIIQVVDPSTGDKSYYKVPGAAGEATKEGKAVTIGEAAGNAVLVYRGGDGKFYTNSTDAGKYEAINTAQKNYDAAIKTATDAMSKTIQAAISAATDAISTMRTYASDFGNNYSIVQNRQNFTENLINVLTEGADSLVLADMNEESANMLALQTRQQLAINSLSLASQASQSVLRLFS